MKTMQQIVQFNQRGSNLVRCLGTLVGLYVGLTAGCAKPTVKGPERIETPEARYARDGQRIEADPVAFLREVQKKVVAFDQYRLTFYRQERWGIPAALGPMEEIQAVFRARPFSVHFAWNDEKMPFYESVYVQGQNDSKLIVRERKGAFLFVPPQVRVLDPMFPVKIGKAKNPITDFGLARIMERTLLPFENPEIRKVTTIKYVGVVNLDPINRPVHYLRIERPKTPGLAYTRQDFYIDAETLLPAGTDLWLPGNELDVRYRYTQVDPSVTLTDADFRLAKDHPRATAKPAK